MNAFEIAFWVLTVVFGVTAIAWSRRLRRQALRSQRLLGGGQR